MTAVATRVARHLAVRETAGGGGRHAWTARHRLREIMHHPLAMSAVMFITALILRLYSIVGSRNLNVDEATYAEISTNVASGRGVTLYGDPFNLHPPVVFATLGAIMKIAHLGGSDQSIIWQLRNVVAIFGSLTVVAIYLSARAIGLSPRLALLTGLLLALDPFGISFDTRVLLEAETQFFLASTVLALILLTGHRADKHRRLLVALAGLGSTLTMCSKETFGLVLALTLLIVLLTSCIPRRETLTIMAIAAVGCLICLTWISLSGGLGPWWTTQTSGFSRLIGTTQITGFNAPTTHVTLVSRIVANLESYAVTYAILVLGGLCALVLLIHDRTWRRLKHPERSITGNLNILVRAWAFSACTYLAYATLIGSIEEQMYYITLAPCLLALATWIGTSARVRRGAWRTVLATLITLALLFDATVWTVVHTHQNNVYASFLDWEPKHVPEGSKIAVTEDIAQFLIKEATIGQWNTPAQLVANRVDYVLVNTELTKQGYGEGTPDLLAYLQANATLAYQAHSSSSGSLLFYDVRTLTKATN